MSSAIRELEPRSLWNHFADLNQVPRASKKEEKVIAFIQAFARQLQLEHHTDAVGNIIIRKPATPGLESRPVVALQSHLDMVHQKNAATDFNFDTQGIEMYVDGDWVKAKGTTLGADNGIGVAAIMALLSSSDIPHPALEALFTIDEETGMTGAFALEGGLLQAKTLLNLDTEEDHELTIGCAGGIDVTATAELATTKSIGQQAYSLQVKGLTGGHSGTEIHLGRGNANKIMNRMLWALHQEFAIEIATIEGGSLRNAIPRESVATLVTDQHQAAGIQQKVVALEHEIRAEYASTDPHFSMSWSETTRPETVLTKEAATTLMAVIYACPNGIYRMSPEIEGLVQTSNNLARVQLQQGGRLSIQCLTRSSVESEKLDLAQAIQACLRLSGATVTTAGSYPGWKPEPDAGIVQLMKNLHLELFGDEAHVLACHAGLECGILGRNYPGMEMISFGPTILGAHSPDERVQISSVQKFWKFLLETLQRVA